LSFTQDSPGQRDKFQGAAGNTRRLFFYFIFTKATRDARCTFFSKYITGTLVMENAIKIRRLESTERSDALKVMRASINQRCARYYGERTVKLWTDKANKHFQFQLPEHLFGAVNGVGPVAIAGWRQQDGVGGIARIGALFTLAEYEEKGLGRRLMEAVEADICEAGYDKVHLFATMNAVSLYRNLGYGDRNDLMLEVADGHYITIRRMVKNL
jgi:GNAT superfamily N-acetyltransferase